jgi:hypothetical protein
MSKHAAGLARLLDQRSSHVASNEGARYANDLATVVRVDDGGVVLELHESGLMLDHTNVLWAGTSPDDVNEGDVVLMNAIGTEYVAIAIAEGHTAASERTTDRQASPWEVGMMMLWPDGADPPEGWFLNDASDRSRSVYADLFDVIGTTYGSSSGSTFRLPPSSSPRSIIRWRA